MVSNVFGKGDVAGAIVDFDRAINVESQAGGGLPDRGKAKRAGGDLDGAITTTK